MSQPIQGVVTCPSCGGKNRIDLGRDDARCGRCKTTLSNAPAFVDDTTLDQLMRPGAPTTLIDFYADWCGPCRMLAPHLEKLAAANPSLRVVKVDTEKHQRWASQLRVSGIPALFVIKDGKVVENAPGFRPLQQLQQLVGPHL